MTGLITVVCYDRIDAIKRMMKLLSKINSCGLKIDLIVSVDYSNKQDEIVTSIRDAFWPCGEFKIIKERENLGLKKHVLKCASRVTDYDFVVLLEDDIVVSPEFISFIIPALDVSSKDEAIAGISLYSCLKNEGDKQPFFPAVDEYDNYYLQFPSSWGAVYTRDQWMSFVKWLEQNDCAYFYESDVPEYICSWSIRSWKKHLARYLVRKNKFFLYPRFSFCSNPGVAGVHDSNIGGLYSVPICLKSRAWKLCTIKESLSVYDINYLPIDHTFLESHYLYDAHFSCGTVRKMAKADFITSTYYVNYREWASIFKYISIRYYKKLAYRFKNIWRILKIRDK